MTVRPSGPGIWVTITVTPAGAAGLTLGALLVVGRRTTSSAWRNTARARRES